MQLVEEFVFHMGQQSAVQRLLCAYYLLQHGPANPGRGCSRSCTR